jgi:hypothetical protein
MVRAMKLAASLLFAFLFCAACGGETPPPASPSQTTGSEQKAGADHDHDGHHEGGDHDKQHANLSPALKDFHGVIAPVWHSDAGSVRIEKACASTKAMQEKAQATGDAELIADVGALDPACAQAGRPDVEKKLGVVHDRFHALMEKK